MKWVSKTNYVGFEEFEPTKYSLGDYNRGRIEGRCEYEKIVKQKIKDMQYAGFENSKMEEVFFIAINTIKRELGLK